MFNLTFSNIHKSTIIPITNSTNEIKNPFVVLAIVTIISSIIFYIGLQNYKKNKLLNKETRGTIISGSCSKVIKAGIHKDKISKTTSCTVSYKYSVENKELIGTYIGGWNTETRVGKEVRIYYNDKEPLISSMKKNERTPIIMMFSAIVLFSLGVTHFIKSKN